MFDGLDNIQWDKLEHAYGPADAVPQIIRDLASDDQDKRHRAQDSFITAVFHQETIYSATVRAIPFLIEIVEDEGVPEREWVLETLANIIQSSYLTESWRVKLRAEDDEHIRQMYTPAELEERYRHNQEMLDHLRAARVEILKGIDTYFGLLDQAEPDIQFAAIGLLLNCRDSLVEIINRLSQLNAKKLDNGVHAFLLLGASIAAPERTDLFSDRARSRSAAPILRIASVLGYWYHNQELPVDKQGILVRAVRKDPNALLELDRLVRKYILELMERDLFEFLLDVDYQHGEQMLPALVDVYTRYQGDNKLLLLMLNFAFHENVLDPDMKFRQLTKGQKMVLQVTAGQHSEYSKMMEELFGSVQKSELEPIIAGYRSDSMAWFYGPHIPARLHQLGIVCNDSFSELKAFIKGKRTAGIPLSEQGN